MHTKESPSHPSLQDTGIHTTGQKDCRAHGVFWWNPLGTQLTTQGHTQHSRQQLVVHTLGHQRSCTHFLYSQDLTHSQRMPVPRTGSRMLQNFNYFYSGHRETRNFNKSGGIIPEQPSAIVKDARGKLLHSPAAGSATMNKNFICWPRVQLYESSLLFLSRNAKGHFLLKFWPAAK